MSVAQILKGKTSEIVTVTSNQSVAEAVRFMVDQKIGAVLVRDGDDLKGIFTERDLMRVVAEGTDMADPIADVMTSGLVTCSPGDTVEAIMEMMTSKRFRHMPVLDDGHLVGIISIGDLVKARMSNVEHEAEALREYIATG